MLILSNTLSLSRCYSSLNSCRVSSSNPKHRQFLWWSSPNVIPHCSCCCCCSVPGWTGCIHWNHIKMQVAGGGKRSWQNTTCTFKLVFVFLDGVGQSKPKSKQCHRPIDSLFLCHNPYALARPLCLIMHGKSQNNYIEKHWCKRGREQNASNNRITNIDNKNQRCAHPKRWKCWSLAHNLMIEQTERSTRQTDSDREGESNNS